MLRSPAPVTLISPLNCSCRYGRAAHVHPQDAVHQGVAVLVDRDGAFALGGAAHRAHSRGRQPGRGASSRPAADRNAAHHSSGDCSAPPSGVRMQPDGFGFPAQHLPADGDQRHFHAGGAEIDGEDDGFGWHDFLHAVRERMPYARSALTDPSTLESTASKRSQRIVDHVVRIGHGGVHAAAGQGDQAAGHVGRAHLFHHVLARLEFLRQLERVVQIQQHHAGGFQVARSSPG